LYNGEAARALSAALHRKLTRPRRPQIQGELAAACKEYENDNKFVYFEIVSCLNPKVASSGCPSSPHEAERRSHAPRLAPLSPIPTVSRMLNPSVPVPGALQVRLPQRLPDPKLVSAADLETFSPPAPAMVLQYGADKTARLSSPSVV